MENLLKVHLKAIDKFYFFYWIIVGIFVITLILSTINYCLIHYSLEFLEENDPDIDVGGLRTFSFNRHYKSFEYSPGISNLGTTGKISVDCYLGKCKVLIEDKTCYDEDGDEYDCSTYKYFSNYSCSNDCRESGKIKCNICRYSDGKCSKIKNDNDYSHPKSCNANNIIYFWKDLEYSSTNRSEELLTYLNSAVTAKENCGYGKKMCGILDNLGNKLCYPEYLDCPINYITLNESEYNKNFSKVDLNNKKIYYTNKKNETGKIVGGLYVDSDLLIKYKEDECTILDTQNLSTFLKNNPRLYKDVLDFDPYKEKDIDSKGNAYLKWCTPGPGKEKNISLIKILKEEYKFNKTINYKYIEKIRNKFLISYFVNLGGLMFLFLFLIILLFSFYYQNDFGLVLEFECCDCCYSNKRWSIFIIIGFSISIICFIIGIVFSSMNFGDLFSLIKNNVKNILVTTIIVLNIIIIIVKILLILIFIIFMIYLHKTPDKEYEF